MGGGGGSEYRTGPGFGDTGAWASLARLSVAENVTSSPTTLVMTLARPAMPADTSCVAPRSVPPRRTDADPGPSTTGRAGATSVPPPQLMSRAAAPASANDP